MAVGRGVVPGPKQPTKGGSMSGFGIEDFDYETAFPFPHAVIDGFWDEELLGKVLAEFADPTDPRWQRYSNENEDKQAGEEALWGPATKSLMSTLGDDLFVAELENMTGIKGLVMETVGGGMHQISRGGKLGVHADFNVSPVTGRFRRLNLLIYLNHEWDDNWGGHLELWPPDDGPKVKIAPEFNRMVIFTTSDHSFHGHPDPLACPEGVMRRSIAAYYFTEDAPEGYNEPHSTVFHQ